MAKWTLNEGESTGKEKGGRWGKHAEDFMESSNDQ